MLAGGAELKSYAAAVVAIGIAALLLREYRRLTAPAPVSTAERAA